MEVRLTSIEFARGHKRLSGSRWQAALTYVLRGVARLRTGTSSWTLSLEDGALCVSNAGEEIELIPGPNTLAAIVRIDVRLLRRILNDRPVIFVCNPDLRHQASYAELRRAVEGLLRALAETGDFYQFHMQAAEGVLLKVLVDSFGSTKSDAPSRADAFAGYLDSHYDEPLTLAQTARYFHLSTEHFAKSFKAEVGQTFHGYLTEARLDAAVDLLTTGDNTISRIALDAGFPNAAALNQAFKVRYGMTPTQYRKEHRAPAEKALPQTLIRELSQLHDDQQPQTDELFVDIDARNNLNPLNESWRDMIGFGAVRSFSDARVREQAISIQKHLGFAHCRILCDFDALSGKEGAYELDSCFDFLVSNGFTPHILIANGADTNPSICVATLGSSLRRFANRYSVQTVRAWRFELPLGAADASDGFRAYLDFFEQISRVLEPYHIATPLIGPGIPPSQTADNLRRFLRAARARNVRLGAISIGCRPGSLSDDAPLARTSDRHYLRNQILLAREALVEEGFDPNLLMVGSWRDSLESHNIMNDSCYEGASILQSVFSAWDLVNSLCYDTALDLSSLSGSGDAFLSGTPGLVSRDGIPKPSHYAFDFLSNVNRHLVYASERCLASTNDMGNYQLVCHNCERLNAAYLATPERALDFQLMSSYFEEQRDRLLRVKITGAQPGTYLVKTRFVNAEGGSVGDASMRMRLWCMDEPSRSEIAHLKAAAQPQMLLERLHSSDGILEFSHLMKSNELAYFHIIYLY